MTRDLAQYEKKANLYLEKCAAAAIDANGDVTTVKKGDPLDFWICQVLKVIVCTLSFMFDLFYFKDATDEFQTDICKVALDLLCVPATSTDCERLFSAAGYLSQNRSSCISPKNLERRCLLKTNPKV